MTITVKFVGALRHSSGAEELVIDYKGCGSVGELVNGLIKEMPHMKRSLVDQELENPRLNALILVNGREIGVLNGLETKLKDYDEVVLVQFVHGG